MAALFFPTPDALRLVLASGVLPAAVTAAPARAGWDAHGRLWVEPAAPIPRSALAALGRFGVQLLGGGVATPELVGGWAELLPLRPAAARTAGPVLFELPDALLGRFVRSLGRNGPRPVGVRLLPGDDRRAWVRCENPSSALCELAGDPAAGVELFTEQVPGVWVPTGWEHPFPDGFTLPPGHVLLLRPPRSVTFHTGLPTPRQPVFPASGRVAPRREGGPVPRVEVPLRLRPAPSTDEPTLWVVRDGELDGLRAVCREAGERALEGYELAACREGVAVRRTDDDAAGLAFPAAGYCPDPRTGLFVPAGSAFRPAVRAVRLATLFGLAADQVTWVEATPGGVPTPRSVPRDAFRPLAAWVSHTAPAPQMLPTESGPLDPFPLARFEEEPAARPADGPSVELLPPSATPGPWAEAEPPSGPPRRGWLARSLDRLAGRRPAGADSARRPGRPPAKSAGPAVSADVLLHGADRAARLRQLEERIVRDIRRVGQVERATGWAELAGVYAATGNHGDAAVCWTNAVWEADEPPADWLDQWYAAECRAARRQTDEPIDRWLAQPGRFGSARVVAAAAARAGFGPRPPGDVVAALPRLLAVLDAQFDDLPARAAWLARAAAARLTGGDPLGLARWRDRLVARLRDKGPGLDLDAPSFLRFHGTAAPDRFRTARDWLVRVRKPVADWIDRLAPTGRLRPVGLDAETECTAAYAQLMLAWGLGCLGERSRSLDWIARARKVLARAGGPGVEPAAHTVLGGLFADRVRGVQDGRPPAGGIPADLLPRYDALPPLARYAVDRLRDHSRILEPAPGGAAFRGLDVKQVRGTDQLGERLRLLADETHPAAARAEARALLDACAADPCSATVPRVAMTLLDASGLLDEATVRETLGHVVPAATWLDAWLQARKWADAERSDRLPKLLARLFAGAASAAARFGLADAARPLAEFLARRAGSDPTVAAGLVRSAGPVFRAFRRLGFGSETADILDRLDPDRGGWPAEAPLPPTRLGLAVGWFAAGDEDAAARLLDDARRRLFVAREGDDRDRTELAIGYADALGFAPPRVALGRLEELFQLLDRVSVTGTTNRYYTLKPLELVDTVVRAVVTEDFALGPAVRGWLADDEFLIRRRIHRDLAAALRDGGGE